jgi:hypothetical protein
MCFAWGACRRRWWCSSRRRSLLKQGHHSMIGSTRDSQKQMPHSCLTCPVPRIDAFIVPDLKWMPHCAQALWYFRAIAKQKRPSCQQFTSVVVKVSGSNTRTRGAARGGRNKPIRDNMPNKPVQTIRHSACNILAQAAQDKHRQGMSIFCCKGAPDMPQTTEYGEQHHRLVCVHKVKKHVCCQRQRTNTPDP